MLYGTYQRQRGCGNDSRARIWNVGYGIDSDNCRRNNHVPRDQQDKGQRIRGQRARKKGEDF